MANRIAVSVLLTPHLDSNRVLLVQRSPELVFFGGYRAFPGGTLDPQDGEVPIRHLDPEEGQIDRENYPLFVAAAARELFEETGVWMGRGPQVPPERLRHYRRLLLEEKLSFAHILRQENQYLDGRDFISICRITTPPFSPLRYDTWFLCCQLPEKAQLEIWPGELEEGEFVRPEEALDRWRRGEILIVPPVIIILTQLLGETCRSFLPRVRSLTASYDRGKLHRVFFSCGVLAAPLATRTRPPATHTNTCLVGEERIFLVDPAPSSPPEQEKLWELLEELREEGRRLEAVLLTHYHPDHVGAALECHRRYGLPLWGHALTARALPHLPFQRHLVDGEELELGRSPDGREGWKLQVLHVPGHSPDHLAFLENRYGALLVGDVVSTLSSVLIDPGEGDMGLYLQSLERLRRLARGTLYPGHGPPARDASRVLRGALEHRRDRETQVLAALRKGARTPQEIVTRVYTDVPVEMHPLAARSVLSILYHLQRQGRVVQEGERYRIAH